MRLNELKAEIARNELTLEEVANKINMNRTTMWRKFNDTEKFTLKEITDMATVLKLDGKRILEIFFTDKVS